MVRNRMRSGSIRRKLLAQLRQRASLENPRTVALASEPHDGPTRPIATRRTRRSSDFLEFAQAAGGFGVFELNLETGEIQGTSLFFALLGLSEGQNGTLTRDELLATVHPEDAESLI